jgi:hypothetical protein
MIEFDMKIDGKLVAQGKITRWEAFKAGLMLAWRALIG